MVPKVPNYLCWVASAGSVPHIQNHTKTIGFPMVLYHFYIGRPLTGLQNAAVPAKELRVGSKFGAGIYRSAVVPARELRVDGKIEGPASPGPPRCAPGRRQQARDPRVHGGGVEAWGVPPPPGDTFGSLRGGKEGSLRGSRVVQRRPLNPTRPDPLREGVGGFLPCCGATGRMMERQKWLAGRLKTTDSPNNTASTEMALLCPQSARLCCQLLPTHAPSVGSLIRRPPL